MLGIYSADERQRYLETGSYEALAISEAESLKADVPVEATIVEDSPVVEEGGHARHETTEAPQVEVKQAHTSAELFELLTGTAVDSPLCMTCGTKMRPAGSCYVCEGCGSTSGCS
jgi:ribonucleoside-diphosphate reductase alpha chain